MSSSSPSSPLAFESASPERAAELAENLAEVKSRVKAASGRREEGLIAQGREPLLVAVSKYKPSADIQACYELGQRDFGENYVQELVTKAKELPQDIRWHFIGALQTNKSKLLASIPNLYMMQTLATIKAADALDRAIPQERTTPLNVLLQVNTSGEESKSGVPPLSDTDANDASSELVTLAQHIIVQCPRLRLLGLMTIGSLAESLSAADENTEFAALRRTRDLLENRLKNAFPDDNANRWGESGRLLLSMGMSSDFEVALQSGSDIVRVGTGVFGERHTKEEK
ncbi:hypothetical protein M0805_009012 [Coniferiporia weirii]|nr:hypothetical protein M0805_009012 [Coniferiporia weirii]